MEIYTLDELICEPALLINRLLIANRTTGSLEALRKQAERGRKGFSLSSGLLLCNRRLIVPIDGTNKSLIADLIREAYDQVSSAHPGQAKTTRILSQKYY
jgi:hypothetical protein